MPNIPLGIILIPYAIILLVFLTITLINITHLIVHGATTTYSFVMTFLFLAGAALILFFTYQEISVINWATPINFNLESPLQ